MTATVGGLWDSLLAEGKPWWITANSDSHQVYTDTAVRGGPDSDFTANGRHTDPVYGGRIDTTQGDYWPGQYSRTHVGSDGFSYAAVMDGIRAAGSGSTTGSSSAASTRGSPAAAAGPPSAAPCTYARAPGSR